ncbi:GatB/YqeY domain-containing protein [bacterium]|nr:GatB/YqeY domain-containing protein [bacterium]
MSLLEQIQKDYLAAMKERNEVKKSALNYVIAQIKNKKIEIQKELEDVDVIKILKKEIKAICETI